MKSLITVISIFLLGSTLQAQTPDVQTAPVHIRLSEDNQLQIDMNLVLPADLKIRSARMMIFTPVLKEGGNERVLPPVYVYGRKREIVNRRKDRLPLANSFVVRRDNRTEQTVAYTASVAFEPWMRHADIVLEKDLCGCGNLSEGNNEQRLAQVALPEPVRTEPALPLTAATTVAETQPRPAKEKKERIAMLDGKAFIDFPVNKTTIYPRYRKNPVELARIDSTLESIQPANIRHIWLHGYASPESPYKHNDFLSKGRTEALKKYIIDKYKLDESVFTLESTPEDWEGLIRLAEACDWPEKDRILEIARSNEEPDRKEAQLRRLIDAYLRMSWHWFPALRHTDYRIEYRIPDNDSEE